jgi:hypothetical protein
MNSNLLAIFQLILGEAEQIIPIFIHNPKSQQIEGIVVTTVNAATAALAGAVQPVVKPAS